VPLSFRSVTGGNAGIGLALCKLLATEDGCHVYMASRSMEKGQAALKQIEAEVPACQGHVELVQLDVCDTSSISAAVEIVKGKLNGEKLFGLVNNAGTGLAHGVDADAMIKTNYFGVKYVTEAFLASGLLSANARLVTVGSGAGPGYVNKCTDAGIKNVLVSPTATLEQIEECLASGLPLDSMKGYGISKACVQQYTALIARTHKDLMVSSCSPGFIDTAITKGFGASKTPDEGTKVIRHCLFNELEASGYYYGSDAVRSPLHFMRNPGEPAYDGVVPSF